VGGGLLLGLGALFLVALLAALGAMREVPEADFDFGAALALVGSPTTITDWTQLFGIAAFAIIGGLFVSAAFAARRGVAGR
jgi:hypothetical protein